MQLSALPPFCIRLQAVRVKLHFDTEERHCTCLVIPLDREMPVPGLFLQNSRYPVECLGRAHSEENSPCRIARDICSEMAKAIPAFAIPFFCHMQQVSGAFSHCGRKPPVSYGHERHFRVYGGSPLQSGLFCCRQSFQLAIDCNNRATMGVVILIGYAAECVGRERCPGTFGGRLVTWCRKLLPAGGNCCVAR